MQASKGILHSHLHEHPGESCACLISHEILSWTKQGQTFSVQTLMSPFHKNQSWHIFFMLFSITVMPYFNYYKEKEQPEQNYKGMATWHTGCKCAYIKISPSPPGQLALRRAQSPGMTSCFTSHVTSASKTEAGVVQELVGVFWISAMPKSTAALQEGDREGGNAKLQLRPRGRGGILVSYSTLWVTASAN